MNDNLYFLYWTKYLGFDFKDLKTGKTLSKGEMFRLNTNIAESLAEGARLPNRFVLIERPTFVPYVEQHGKRKESNQSSLK